MIKTYDTKELVPEAQRESAIETKDSKWIVDEPDPGLGEKGKKALDDERAAKELAERKLREKEEELATKIREAAARATGATEAQLKEIRDGEALARKPIVDENIALKAEVDRLTRHNTLRTMGEKVWLEDRIEDALDAAVKRTRPGDAGGVVVLDKAGKDTADTLEKLITETLKAEKPWLYRGKGKGGGGAPPNDASEDDEPPPPVANTHADRVRAAL